MPRILPILALCLALATPAPAQEALRGALDAAARGDWAAAAARVAPGSLDADIVEWLRLRDPDSGARLGDYEAFLARHPGWPGLRLLRERGETAVARSTDPARVLAWFGAEAPQTVAGSMALVAALLARGRTTDAQAETRRAWIALEFDTAEEAAFLSLAGDDIGPQTHARRLDRLLWDGAVRQAGRMLARVAPGPRALGQARLALLNGQTEGVNALIAAVPGDLSQDPGLAHDRFQWRVDQGLYEAAAALVVERSAAGTLGDPAAWAPRRARLARELAEQGQPRLAYRVAAGHGLTQGADFADLEFLAGFLALRRLDDPATALTHFRRLGAGVSTPISLARAAYWEGRALQAQGEVEAAEAAYRAAARHGTTYYGLLAAETLGLPLDPAVIEPRVPPADPGAHAGATVVAAGRALSAAGDRVNAKRFFLHHADSLAPDEMAGFAAVLAGWGETHVSMVVAKRAAEAGALVPALHHPVPDLIPDGLPVSRALALAIARRESEFDIAAGSSAGAQGLMQVMPATAEEMARATGQTYARARLTTDAAYNVSLGAAYLAKLVEEFGPAVALVAAGYNAGPGRPRRWIAAFGDPRTETVDVVDWVEQIPIAETRTYVQRVAESLVIYRAKLRGTAGPVRLRAELSGR
jgi:soluble lytic murein transglycosylase